MFVVEHFSAQKNPDIQGLSAKNVGSATQVMVNFIHFLYLVHLIFYDILWEI